MAIKPLPEDENKDVAVALGAEAADGEGGKKLNAKKIVLFVVVPLFLLAGGGGAAYFTGMLDKFLPGASEESAEGGEHGEAADGHGKKAETKKGAHGEASSGHFLQIPNMLVNLTAEGQPRYLRLSVQLELENETDKAAIEAVMPRVVDQFQTYLRELRVKDLRGSAGIYRLQIELLNRVNAAAYPIEVKDVLFQEILIQ